MRSLRPQEKSLADEVFRGTVPLDRVLISPLIGLSGRPFTIPGSMFMAVSVVAGFATGGYAWLSLIPELMADISSKYIIFLGAQGYRDARNLPWDDIPGETLIHELTHVWQGHHSTISWSYALQSLGCQVKQGRNAYTFVLNDDNDPASRRGSLHTAAGNNPVWSSWGVEQQAQIVQGWFTGFIGFRGTAANYQGAYAGRGGVFNDPNVVVKFYRPESEDSPAFAYVRNNIRTGNPNYDNYRYGSRT